jgi:Amt family ammonium transporter
MGSMAIGLAAGIVCSWAVGLKYKAGYDDALDVVGVHAVGGMLGALLIGVFADTAFNEAGADGLLAGGGLTLLGKQAVAVVATWPLLPSASGSSLVDLVVGLRVTEDDLVSGLDISRTRVTTPSPGRGSAAHVPTGTAPPERAPSTVRVPQGDLG